jgi:peptidoglycan/xylan/chitin deacetylase (PgdA/CDA1 family)
MKMLANFRQTGRALAIRALSLRKLGVPPAPGIRFVCYHDVLAHETASLEAQLLLIGSQGEFLGLDQAVDLMAAQAPLDRPLFVVTFDDGLESTYRHAWPVFERLGVPFSVFVITDFAGRAGYFGWAEAREMARSSLVTIGSHSVGHRNLGKLSEEEVRYELVESKAKIESTLGRKCDHFCCPWGRPGRDFLPDRDPRIAGEAGYRSFLTTARGITRTGDRLPLVKRDVIHMHSSAGELRHFLF